MRAHHCSSDDTAPPPPPPLLPPLRPERIAAVRRMIAATELDSPEKGEALEELKNYQRTDFEGIFK